MVNPAAIPGLQKFRAKIFIRDEQFDVMEGNPNHLNILVEFRSIGAAYKAPEYQDMIRVRTPKTKNALASLKKVSKWPTVVLNGTEA